MKLEPGMRVRCVYYDQDIACLGVGVEYTVVEDSSRHVTLAERPGYRFMRDRFKPIVRVKMGRVAA